MILTLKNKFHHYKSPIFKRCRHRDINIILVSNKIYSIYKKKKKKNYKYYVDYLCGDFKIKSYESYEGQIK